MNHILYLEIYFLEDLKNKIKTKLKKFLALLKTKDMRCYEMNF